MQLVYTVVGPIGGSGLAGHTMSGIYTEDQHYRLWTLVRAGTGKSDWDKTVAKD